MLLNYQGVVQKVRLVVVNIDHQHDYIVIIIYYNNIIMLYREFVWHMYMFMKILWKELTHESSSMINMI